MRPASAVSRCDARPAVSQSVRAPGHPGLRTEAMLMRFAREAGVPEPEVYAVLEPADELGDGFIMQWLEGEALGARIVRGEAFAAVRPKLAFECGQILARIHAIDLKKTGLDKLLDPMDPAAFVDQTWERYKLFHTPQPMIDYAGRWLKEHLPKNPRSTLVHNDFRNGNFMVGAERRRCGARLGSGAHRRSDARSRLDLHELVAFRPQRSAGRRLRRIRGSVSRLRIGLRDRRSIRRT